MIPHDDDAHDMAQSMPRWEIAIGLLGFLIMVIAYTGGDFSNVAVFFKSEPVQLTE